MSIGTTLRGAPAVALMLMAATALAAPLGDRTDLLRRSHAPLPAQAAPDTPPQPEAPADLATPPPILPAPDLPTDDPVVELPPVEASPLVGSAPASPVFSFADLAERLLDSVVYISTSQHVALSRRTPPPSGEETPPGGEDFFDDFFDEEENGEGDPRTVQSLGSGFVIDAAGLIVTNNHVIADADEIVANFANGSKLTAEVVGVDDKTDLALLRVTPNSPLKAAKFGRSDALRIGDWALAIGNPFGFGGTVTLGIVSALDRDINSGPYDHYIQTDASINRGNSGGPLFNIDGEVVGINTAIMSPTGGSIGIGFAVPSEIAVPVIEQLRQFGTVRRGWIGVRIQDVTDDVAKSLGMTETSGAMVAGLSEDGPAAKGGLLEGDVVLEFNGKPVKSMRELPRLVADTPPGDKVDVLIVRDGERMTLKVEVGLLEDEKLASAEAGSGTGDEPGTPEQQTAAEMFGLSLGEITDEARKSFSIGETVEGVLVTAVQPGSEAEEKSLKAGEVIVQVSQTDVTDPDQVIERINKLKEEGRRTVMLLVSGADNKLRFVSLRFEEAPATPEPAPAPESTPAPDAPAPEAPAPSPTPEAPAPEPAPTPEAPTPAPQ
jgi:serine protease Do